jgi:hypothetical protein
MLHAMRLSIKHTRNNLKTTLLFELERKPVRFGKAMEDILKYCRSQVNSPSDLVSFEYTQNNKSIITPLVHLGNANLSMFCPFFLLCRLHFNVDKPINIKVEICSFV